MKLMESLFAGNCRVCHGRIAKGESIWYDSKGGKGNKTLHARCNESLPVPEPMRSATPAYAGDMTIERHFESVGEYTALQPNEKNSDFWSRYKLRALEDFAGAGNKTSIKWFGIEGNYPAVVCALNGGWADGLRRVQDNLQDVTAPAIAGLRRRTVRADFGDEVDIHRVNNGDCERAWSMRKRRMSAHGHAQKTIIVQIAGNKLVSAEQLFWRGAAAIKMCDAMTDAGYAVEIVGVLSADNLTDSGHKLRDSFTIKALHMPLDRLELATVTCLAGFFRLAGFKSMASIPLTVRDSLGTSVSEISKRFDTPDTIRGLEAITDLATAQAFINKTIASLSHEDDALAA